MSSKYTKILFTAVFLFALAVPSRAQTAPSEIDPSPYVTMSFTPPSVLIGESSTVAVNLNNVPAEGIASAEFTCTYDPAMVEISAITPSSLFGADPIIAVNGPQNGKLIFAIAGSIGNKATMSGAAFTFSAKGLQVGEPGIDCQVRVSTGNLVLVPIPSTPARLTVMDIVTTPAQGTFSGHAHASKPVTVTLTDSNGSVAGSVTANADGTFSLTVPPGTYSAVLSAPGHLRAQGSVNITSGNTTSLQPITLPAGDIDGNDVIDQFDALTIGINYNGTEPAVADLSNDGTINVLELEILSPNYRHTGPVAVSTGDSPAATSSPDSQSTQMPPVATNSPVSNPTQLPPNATNSPMPPPIGTPINQGNHDRLHWHGSAGNDHEHGDNPNAPEIVAIFGAAGEYWNSGTGATIGVPFETSPLENTMKHEMAKYYTMTSQQIDAAWIPSTSTFNSGFTEDTDNGGNPTTNRVRAWRMLVHGGANLMEALGNNHSAFVEVQLCTRGNSPQCGTFRSGGWIFWGKLQAPFYNQVHQRPGGTVTFPDGMNMTFKSDAEDLAAINSPNSVFDDWGGEPYWFMFPKIMPDGFDALTFARANSGLNIGDQLSSNEVGPNTLFDCAPFPRGSQCGNRLFHIAIRIFDGWNLLDTSNVNNPVFICTQISPSNCEYNGTLRGMKEVAVWIDPAWDQASFDQDSRPGFVTMSSFTDRYQRLRPAGACTSIGVDCVPLVLTNAPVGYASIKLKIQEPVPGIDREYDCPGGGCISHPN
jgi:hypothetical protein